MKASTVARQGLTRIKGWPFMAIFGWITKKSMGYSHESMVTITSSKTLVGLTLDLWESSSTMTVGWGYLKCSMSKIVMVMIIAIPKWIKVFSIGVSLIKMVITRFPRSMYFSIKILPVINLANWPATCIVAQYFHFLVGFLIHNSLMVFVWIGTSSRNKIIFIQIFFNYV